MTGVVGSFGLVLATVGSLAATVLWSSAALGRGGSAAARQAAGLALVGALVAFAALEWAMLRPDLSVSFAARNSSTSTPLYYRFTGAWSGLEGSMVLWLLVLAGYLVLAGLRVPRGLARLHPWAMSVVAAVAFTFQLVTLLAASPFAVVDPVPVDGPGPNPLLASHPAMGIHPPLLYLGYLGLVVPFGYAVAALVTGQGGAAWARATRRWTLFAWTMLTAGIVLGAWWAYAVLGWGGYWAWDPVENASLLPWLTATALLHSAMLRRRLPAQAAWTTALAASSFLLVCLGTFLTRSGVVASVHSFSESPLGPVLLGVTLLLALLVLGLLVWRADRLVDPAVPPGAASSPRAGALLANNVVLVGLVVVVLTGTVLPVLVQVAGGPEVGVGAPYYDRVVVPAVLALLVLMVAAPSAGWHDPWPVVARRAAFPALVGAGVVALAGALGASGVLAVLACGLGAAVVAAVVRDLATATLRSLRRRRGEGGQRSGLTPRRVGGQVAHAGIAVAAVAVAASSTWASSTEVTLEVGESTVVGQRELALRELDRGAGADAMSVSALLEVAGDPDRSMRPVLQFFPGRQVTLSRPGIDSTFTEDVYATLLAVEPSGSTATLRLTVTPLVGWLWAGGLLVAVGGALSLLPSRRPATAAAVGDDPVGTASRAGPPGDGYGGPR